jgi:Fic family protein
MADAPGGDRKSKAASPDLIRDPHELARQEAENGLRQAGEVLEMVEHYRETRRPFKLRISTILHLHRTALERISLFAGNFRPADVIIGGSAHQPAGAHLVAEQVEEMCDYINGNWDSKTAIHLAGYVLWRLNWIHPFDDGNGRTSRALSYLVLCVKLGYRIPGSNTIPEQISDNKPPYYAALEAADKAWRITDRVDVSELERLLEGHLAAQLVGVIEEASGQSLLDD